MTEIDARAPLTDLEVKLEALLFVAAGPVSILQLAEVLDRKQEEVEAALNELAMGYARRGALALQWHVGRVQLTTAPQMAALVERFLGLEATARLSKASMEALAIVAYRQPITRPGIDAVRGVSSDGVIKSLISKGLIQEAGRAEGPGRPILYETTADFLQHFGLSSLNELPPFELSLEEAQQQKPNQLLKD
jgi:segregation and condensation protein B